MTSHTGLPQDTLLLEEKDKVVSISLHAQKSTRLAAESYISTGDGQHPTLHMRAGHSQALWHIQLWPPIPFCCSLPPASTWSGWLTLSNGRTGSVHGHKWSGKDDKGACVMYHLGGGKVSVLLMWSLEYIKYFALQLKSLLFKGLDSSALFNKPQLCFLPQVAISPLNHWTNFTLKHLLECNRGANQKEGTLVCRRV